MEGKANLTKGPDSKVRGPNPAAITEMKLPDFKGSFA